MKNNKSEIEEEFNLSKKRLEPRESAFMKDNPEGWNFIGEKCGLFREEDVKEFIRLLKEEITWINGDWYSKSNCIKAIEKLAGDKLI